MKKNQHFNQLWSLGIETYEMKIQLFVLFGWFFANHQLNCSSKHFFFSSSSHFVDRKLFYSFIVSVSKQRKIHKDDMSDSNKIKIKKTCNVSPIHRASNL